MTNEPGLTSLALMAETLPTADTSSINSHATPPSPNLLPFCPDGSERTINGVKKLIPIGIVHKILRHCSLRNTNLFELLFAAYYAVICRYSEQKNLGLVVHDATDSIAKSGTKTGYSQYPVHLLLDEDSDTTFSSLLSVVKSIIREHSERQRNGSYNAAPSAFNSDPIQCSSARAYFSFQDGAYISGGGPGTDGDSAFAKYQNIETALRANRSDAAGLTLSLEYRVDLYNSEDMDRFLENYIAFLSSATIDFENPICDIAMCGETELHHLNNQFWNMKSIDNPWGSDLFINKFLQIVEKMPDFIALESPNSGRWTYAHLNHQAQHMRNILTKRGITAGTLVGILCEPSLECIAAILGILLARCGYVPLDSNSPIDRLAFMVDDCALKHIIVGKSYSSIASAVSARSSSSIKLIPIDNMEIRIATEWVEQSNCVLSQDYDPFYVIYTSVS